MGIKPVPVQKLIHATTATLKAIHLGHYPHQPSRTPRVSFLELLTSQSKLHRTEWLMKAHRSYANFFTAKETGFSVFYLGETDLIKQKFCETWGFCSNMLDQNHDKYPEQQLQGRVTVQKLLVKYILSCSVIHTQSLVWLQRCLPPIQSQNISL